MTDIEVSVKLTYLPVQRLSSQYWQPDIRKPSIFKLSRRIQRNPATVRVGSTWQCAERRLFNIECLEQTPNRGEVQGFALMSYDAV